VTDHNENQEKLNKANIIDANQQEEELDGEKKKSVLNTDQVITIIVFIGAILLFLYGLFADKALAFGLGFILILITVGLFAHLVKKPLKIWSFILFGLLLAITIFFIPSLPVIDKIVNDPTPSPTPFPTCAEVTCPTVEVTPCPTYEITPCPTCEVVQNPAEPTLTQPVPSPTPTVPWNFQDGCIFYDWHYIPDTWINRVEDDVTCGGYDYSHFGFKAEEYYGSDVLSISFPSADGIYDFGIYRNFSGGLSYIKIEFTVANLIHGLEDTTFINIGFGKTPDLRNFEGSYFRVYNITTDEYISIKIRDEWNPEYENNEKWLGYIDKGSKVTIECDEVFDRKIKCNYMLDGLLQAPDLEVYLPQDWNSLYIGYEISKGGTIEVFIDEIVVYQ